MNIPVKTDELMSANGATVDELQKKFLELCLRGEIEEELRTVHATELDKLHEVLRVTERCYQLEIEIMGNHCEELEKRHQQLNQLNEKLEEQLHGEQKQFEEKMVEINLDVGDSSNVAEQKKKFEKKEAVNASFSGNNTDLEKVKMQKLAGKWKLEESSGNLGEYVKQFDWGFFCWMATSHIELEIDENELRLARLDSHEKFMSFDKFTLGKEFTWIIDGSKYKVIIGIDAGKLVGKEIRMCDGKISIGEMVVNSDGMLSIRMESDGVEYFDKYSRVYE